MAVDGNEIIVQTGSDGAEVTIGSQKGATFSRNAEMLDVSTKGSDDAAYLPGKRTFTVDCNSFYVAGDAALAALVTAYEAGNTFSLVWSNDDGSTDYKKASAYVSSMSVDAPAHGPAEISISFQCTGAVS